MQESGCRLEHPAATQFRHHVMDGEWHKVCVIINIIFWLVGFGQVKDYSVSILLLFINLLSIDIFTDLSIWFNWIHNKTIHSFIALLYYLLYLILGIHLFINIIICMFKRSKFNIGLIICFFTN